ncbi:carbohydrate ABC transporter permease [Bradyrhizobium sp.]|uniref:carbohydrate ABC transporter permease n=1 Tax=Bradyrhizobium sp. TaxID=376 RepID=UPI002BE9AE6E|nr:sugar ABC transporter permease [Bradyrhizobium sp.]HMM88927.1 sugar ABC transporter permease [Bradyrhizobium sp.]
MRWQRGLWLFLAPSFGLMTLVLLWPLGYAAYLSAFDYHLGSPGVRFVGLANYTQLLGEARFWQSLWTTLLIAFGSVAVEFALGFALALALYKLTFSVRAFMILLFLPHIITPVVATLFLKWILTSNWGLIDATLLTFNINPPDWLGNPMWAKICVVLADAWIFTPFVMLVLYAALQTLDQAQIEAAKIDGAGGWRILRHIVLPSMVPVIVFTVSVRLMDVFRFFDTIYVLTGGGPGTATETITMYTYQLGFQLLQVGKASALGIITLVIVAAIIATFSSILHRGYGRSG